MPEKDGGKFRDQDAGTIMAAVSGNRHDGKTVAWNFFKTNWDSYIFPTYVVLRLLSVCIYTKTTQRLQKLNVNVNVEVYSLKSP